MGVYLGNKAVSVYNGGQNSINLEEKTITAGTSTVEVVPSDGKYLSKITINPTPTEEKTITPTSEDLIVSPGEGNHLSQVTVQGDANFLEENIAEGITIWGKTGTHQGGGLSGSYVWTKQGMSETVTEDTTGGTYTLTTPNDSRPSSEIEMCTAAPIYDSSKRQWNFDSTSSGYMKGMISNEDRVLPPIGVGQWPSEIYVRVTSEPNIWYLVTEFSVGNSSPYLKNMTYSKKFTADIDWAKKYLTGKEEDKYPVNDWDSDGYYYRRIVSDPNVTGGGYNWTKSNDLTDVFLYSVYYANGIWVAGGSGKGYYSINGKTWIQSNNKGFESVYYANGIWVANKRYSTDGITWIQSNITSGSFYGVYNANGLWVAGSSNGLYYSTDGKTWTKSNITSGTLKSVYYANGIWVAVGYSGGAYYSIDGKTWTQGNITSDDLYYVYYDNGLWVTCGYGGLYYSTDGNNWTKSNVTSGDFRDVCYANGIWVAVGYSGGAYYSIDGKTWTQGNGCGTNANTISVCYANGIWVAGSESYGLYYSTDGKNWTKSNVNSLNFKSVYYANGIWVAVGPKGAYYSETLFIDVDF